MNHEKFKKISKKALIYLFSILFLSPNNIKFGLENISAIEFRENETSESKINNFKINIKYRDAYNIDESWKEFKKVESKRINEVTVHSLGKDLLDPNSSYGINLDKLLEKVIYNNNRYINFNMKNPIKTDYSEYDKKTLSNLLKIILDYINAEVKTNSNVTLEEMASKLYNLEILNGHKDPIYKVTEAAVKDGYALIIYQDRINEINLTDEQFIEVICHEVEHLIQQPCPNRNIEEVERENGSSVALNDNNSVDSYWYRFLYEATAESMASSNNNLEPRAYKDQLPFLSLLKLCVISSKANKAFSLEESQYELSFESLYKIFNATTEEERKELHFMLLGFETYLVDRSDVISNIRSEYNSDLDRQEIKDQLLADSLKIATKLFYENLMQTNVDYPLTVKNNFLLISIYDEMLDEILENYFSSNEIKKDEVINVNNIIRNFYFLQLESKYNISLDILYSNYQDFKATPEMLENEFGFLPEKELNFLKELLNNKIILIK